MRKQLFTLILLLAAGLLAGCGASDALKVGEGTLQLSLSVPEGYHLNTNTISRITWEVDGTVVQANAELQTELVTLDEPVTLAVTFAEGEAAAIAHLDVRYCTDDEQRCIFEEKDLQLPVKVESGGGHSTLAAQYAIVPPEDQ